MVSLTGWHSSHLLVLDCFQVATDLERNRAPLTSDEMLVELKVEVGILA